MFVDRGCSLISFVRCRGNVWSIAKQFIVSIRWSFLSPILSFFPISIPHSYPYHIPNLKGDAIAMSVDVFSYITNLVAENTKESIGRVGNPRSEYQRIVTEIAIPSFSVLCLLGVTGYIAYDAINVLKHPPLVDDVPLVYLYGFAFLNLIIDVVCATLFVFRGRDVFEEPKMLMPAHVPTIRYV